MTKLSQKITDRIQEERISQTPHWVFVVKYTTFWFIFALALLLGAAAFAVILFTTLETDFEVWGSPLYPPLLFFLHVLPFFWLLIFLLLVSLAYFGIHYTKKGYRLRLSTLVLSNLIGSIAIGGGIYAIGGGEIFENFLAHRLPGYQAVEERQEDMWSHPEAGLLGGQILAVDAAKNFTLQDFQGKVWNVEIVTELSIPPLPQPPTMDLNGHKVKIIGEQKGDTVFTANRILPWRRHRPPLEVHPLSEDQPEQRLMKVLELRDALRHGDLQRAATLQQELLQMLPVPGWMELSPMALEMQK